MITQLTFFPVDDCFVKRDSGSVVICYKGTRATIAEWARITGYSVKCISNRVNSLWDARRIIETPPHERKVIEERNIKSKEKLYHIWRQMRQRCNNPHNKDYKNYGARGIRVDSVFDDYEMFRTWAIQNGYNETLTLDRIDVNSNYSPSNCRWATNKEQANNKQKGIRIEHIQERIQV